MVNIVDILDSSAARYPDKVALRYRDKRFTYAEMKERVACLVSVLDKIGIKRHDHLVLISPNTNASLELLFASARRGAVLEQYSTRLSRVITAELLGRSEAQVAFVSRRLFATAADFIEVAERPFSVFFIDDEEGSTLGVKSEIDGGSRYEDLIAAAPPSLAQTEGGGAEAAVLLCTSGTTGIPRGVLISHEAIMHQVRVHAALSGLNQTSIQLSSLPFFHITFLSALEALSVAAELVVLDVCKGSDIAWAIHTFGVTHASLIPFALKDLTAYVEDTGIAIDSLKLVLYGAEPIYKQQLEQAKHTLGCDFMQGYGMTETTAAVTMLLPEHHHFDRYLATAGKALPGVEIKIVERDGKECPVWGKGEIAVKTPGLMLAYYKDTKRTNEVIQGGWYYTGDIGYLDEEGFLHLVARKDDMVISGGENIYPQEITSCIKEMDGVADAAALGVADKQWGEAVVAFVVLKKGSALTAADIVSHCADRLGSFKKPQKVFFVEGLTRGSSGKVSKKDLKKLFESLKQRDE